MYYQQFGITCEIVDLADSKAVHVSLFSVLVFAIFPAISVYLLNKLSVAHVIFEKYFICS